MADPRVRPEDDHDQEVSLPHLQFIRLWCGRAPLIPQFAFSSERLLLVTMQASPRYSQICNLLSIFQDVSQSELVIEACRRNNVDLLLSVLDTFKNNSEDAAKLLNSATTVMGNYAYHEAALRGNCRISPQSSLSRDSNSISSELKEVLMHWQMRSSICF
jgi:hypothetical protein